MPLARRIASSSVVKAHGDEHRPEDLFLRQAMIGRHVADHGRRYVEAIGRHVRGDAALTEEAEAVALGEVEI